MNSMGWLYSQQVLTLSRNDREIVKTSDFGDQLLWSNTTDRDNDNLYRKFLPSLHVNIQNTHWCLIELDTEESDILMYDSLDWKNKTFRSVKNSLPWKLPNVLIKDLVIYAVARVNIFRTTALTQNVT